MAYNHRKSAVTEHVYADTVVWQCSACNCWSRPEFVSGPDPACPICASKMIQETKNIRVE